MIDLGNIDDVKALQTSLRTCLDNPNGKEVMKFLEQICGWFDFKETNTERLLVQNGKRQIVATLKTLLDLPAEQIVQIAKGF